MTAIVPTSCQGQEISFNEDGWFNATRAAARFEKRPNDWLQLQETKAYIEALNEILITSQNGNYNHQNTSEGRPLTKTRRGRHNSGTWFQPKLAVPFTRWLDVRFSLSGVICKLARPLVVPVPATWKRMRSKATTSFRVMNDALPIDRARGPGQADRCAPLHR